MIWIVVAGLVFIAAVFVYDTFKMRKWDEDMDRRLEEVEKKFGKRPPGEDT